MSDQQLDYGQATAGVTDRLRDAIISGAFTAGERIKLAAVASELGVSSMPIREAMRTLEAEGLVTIIPNRGAVVRPIDPAFVRQTYEIRGAIEALLVERACLELTFDVLRKLEAVQTDLEAAAERDDFETLLRLNAAFHNAINACGGNPEAERILGLNQNIIVTLRRRLGFHPGRLRAIVEEHARILSALRCRDVTEAVNLSRLHVASAREDMINQIRKYDNISPTNDNM